MRKAIVILCVLILIGGFVAAWFELSLEGASPGAGELAKADDPSGELQPLDTPETRDHTGAGHRPDGSIGTGREDRTEDRTSEVEVERGSAPGGDLPEVDTRRVKSSAPAPGDLPPAQTGGESPEDAAASSGKPEPQPFIKGHQRPPGQNLGNVRPRSRRITQPAGVKKLYNVTPKLRQDRRGLYAQYFGLHSADLTKLDTSDPDLVRIDRQVYFPDREAFSDLPISLDNFAAEWTGFLVIDEPGDYWLFWGADNGGRVELDGETVLLQDGMVRYVEVSALLTLEPGLHPLKIEFAQTKNNVADWAKCAAALMYVPEGESKPVPVPPEMLMVPEWMWSDNAPIITKLSKTEGEIGDELTIHGQALYTKTKVPALGGSVLNAGAEFADQTRVFFAGQEAAILEQSDSELRVRVPIGARSGDVMVTKAKPAGWIGNMNSLQPAGWRPAVPSNSVHFTVTTQFGLMAEWHDLEGWENFGFEVLEERQPELTRIDDWPGREADPEEFGVAAISWKGRIGLPARNKSLDGVRTSSPFKPRLVFAGMVPFRVSVASQLVESALDQVNVHVAIVTSDQLTGGYFEFELVMLLLESEQSTYWQVGYEREDYAIVVEGNTTPLVRSTLLRFQHFFPPVVPPSPPVISAVEAVWEEGEQPVVPPYEADLSRPAVKVGQEFTFVVRDEGPAEIWDSLPTITIDGIPVEYTVSMDMQDEPNGEDTGEGSRTLSCRATMPDGVGEGRMVARLSFAVSEPVFVDITNRGLVGYLYDVPEANGLNELPDLGPLHCFKIRKDKQINFESAADFDLPFPAETFVIEWLGGLVIEEEGDYEFICRSDDGMMLWLDDNVIIDANHRQAPAENKATVHLVPGTYRFRMQYFENNQHEVCVLEWRATRGEGAMLEELIPRQVIPPRAFSLDIHPPFPAKTSTGKKTDGS